MNHETNRTLAVLTFIVVLCLVAQLLVPTDPLAVNVDARLAAPSVSHYFGTDELGRDVLSRMLHGAGLTMTFSVLALITSLAIGIGLGGIAGYFGGRWPDRVISWFCDFLTAIPFIVVLAALLSVFGSGIWRAYGALVALMWVAPARIVRAAVLQESALEYVAAQRALGSSDFRTLTVVLLPACIHGAILFSVSYLPEIIAIEAALSFLGLGVQPPHPGLGKMIFEGSRFITSAWWLAVFPAAMLFVLVSAVQIVAWTASRKP